MVYEQLKSEDSTPKEKETNKKIKIKEDVIKRKLQKANQDWNDWKFQIHGNKLEWVNPRSSDEQKIHFVCLVLKENITLKLHIGLVTRN